MNRLFIIGNGNFSRVVRDYCYIVLDENDWEVEFILSDCDNQIDADALKIETYIPKEEDYFITSYVSCKDREYAASVIEKNGGKFINIVHPTANILKSAKIGIGNIIGAYTTISSNVTIGNYNIIQDNCNIGHDSLIENYVHLYVGTILSGKNRIENKASIYTASTVFPNITVENGSVVGAGSVVMRKVKAGTSVLGYPAKVIE